MPNELLGESEIWAIVDLTEHGHGYAGRVSEHLLGGTGFIRVDVPAQPEKREQQSGRELIWPAVPAFTKLLGCSVIYSITPCSEEVARHAAENRRCFPCSDMDLAPRFAPVAAQSSEAEILSDYARREEGNKPL